MVGRYSSWSIRKIYKKFTKVFGMLKNLYPFLSCTRYQLDIVFGSLFSLHRTLARQVSEKRLSRFFSIKYQVIGTRYWHFGNMLGNSKHILNFSICQPDNLRISKLNTRFLLMFLGVLIFHVFGPNDFQFKYISLLVGLL